MNSAGSLRDKFLGHIGELSLVEHADRVLLAVSGGVDSMVMLSLFSTLHYDVGVAHCNFQLRGEEAEEDELMVEKEAKRLGMPYYNIRFDTREEMDRTGESVQMAARRLRYAWFDSLCVQYGYTVIAIAHHADDSVETFFINLFRGTGLRGLTGIGVTNGRIIRPLLFCTRKEIVDYAHQHHVQFREDSSNRSTKYLRNKIRLGLIPRIREINPRFTELMSSNIHRLTEAQLFINRSIERMRNEIVERNGDEYVIDPSKIDPEYPIGYVIYELMKMDGFKGYVIDSLCQTLHKHQSGKRFYSKDKVAWIDRGRIIVTPIGDDDMCEVVVPKGKHKAYCGNKILFFDELSIDDLETTTVPPNVALLDMDKLSFPLMLRRWKEGDSFTPIGMTGHKKVSDLLIDQKISVAEKKRQFVVESAGQIVWVVGLRIDDSVKITSRTENILRIVSDIV